MKYKVNIRFTISFFWYFNKIFWENFQLLTAKPSSTYTSTITFFVFIQYICISALDCYKYFSTISILGWTHRCKVFKSNFLNFKHSWNTVLKIILMEVESNDRTESFFVIYTCKPLTTRLAWYFWTHLLSTTLDS